MFVYYDPVTGDVPGGECLFPAQFNIISECQRHSKEWPERKSYKILISCRSAVFVLACTDGNDIIITINGSGCLAAGAGRKERMP